ncbi:hypothetical protein GN956_G13600 [Arapaima gigas]
MDFSDPGIEPRVTPSSFPTASPPSERRGRAAGPQSPLPHKQLAKLLATCVSHQSHRSVAICSSAPRLSGCQAAAKSSTEVVVEENIYLRKRSRERKQPKSSFDVLHPNGTDGI